MPKFTPEFIEMVRETYKKELSYKKTADKLHIDERAVKRIIEGDRKAAIPDQVGIDNSASTARQSQSAIVKGTREHGGLTRPPQSGVSESDIAMKYKTIYAALMAGKSAPQIIAQHGFDPEFVEKQVRLFSQQQECDPVDLQKKILKTLNNLDSHAAGPYLAEFELKGYLTNNKVIELIREIGRRRGEAELTKVFSYQDQDPPHGWTKLRCITCGKSYAIVRDSDDIIQSYGKNWGGNWHVKCGPPHYGPPK